jgi:hypothetical protein
MIGVHLSYELSNYIENWSCQAIQGIPDFKYMAILISVDSQSKLYITIFTYGLNLIWSELKFDSSRLF